MKRRKQAAHDRILSYDYTAAGFLLLGNCTFDQLKFELARRIGFDTAYSRSWRK